jgi:glucans biosynthesis protein
LATVIETRVGAGPGKGTRLFVIDFTGGSLAELNQDAPVEPIIALSAGIVKALVARPNPMIGGWRVSFILETGGAKLCDLRCTLKLGDKVLSEVWSYRWTL